MPARKKEYDEAVQVASWIDALDSSCLREVVTEAFVARRMAVRAKGSDKIIASGDSTLEQIQFGKYTGDKACQKATVALRKFDEAYMGTQRPAYGRALKRRYGHASTIASQVLLFNNVAHPDRAARLHAATCPMLNTAKRRSSVQRFDDPPQEDIDDLNERGFPVKMCKCLKRTP